MDVTYEETSRAAEASEAPAKPLPRTETYAGFWMRFWAYLLDLVVVAGVNGLLISPFFIFTDASVSLFGIFGLQAVLTSLVLYVYFVLMTKLRGQTLGKMVFGLRVARVDKTPLTWSSVLFREVIGRFIHRFLFITNLLYIAVAFTPQKQGVHDIFADTCVLLERPR
ncbi:putative RDD family membrane protein YckC [Salsuginibacillus halophilus]|uniref:Putative RDD family membrane protein YckC n=1 Tax=Salsuginibacillus halophilus TaxID=517424 RepID=A0A2P8HBM7_9BACI|nr:RDD family protein [Salsuginibacillus halophilus]PSL43629.1 putative RDD family membrane protein YckC [Salsuginibacillus halophilus]